MESIYKIDTGSDHVAKFRGDRPRELGDLAAKKKKRKHHEHFISPPVTPYGRPNKCNLHQYRHQEVLQSVMFVGPLVGWLVNIRSPAILVDRRPAGDQQSTGVAGTWRRFAFYCIPIGP